MRSGSIIQTSDHCFFNQLMYCLDAMTGTTAKAHLFELLLEPILGCKGLYTYRKDLMHRVIAMSDRAVREHLDHLEQSR